MAYAPSISLPARIRRRVTPFLARRTVPFTLERSVVTITFDDCPRSVIKGGLVPMQARGWRSTIYIAGGLLGAHNHHGYMMDGEDVAEAYKAGHEIGDHSYSHIDGAEITIPDFIENVDRNQTVLSTLGIPRCETFAYPYGQATPALKKRLADKFIALRGIRPGVMRGAIDLNQVKSTPLFNANGIDAALAQVASLKDSPGWLTLFTHDIRKSPSLWGCTSKDFITVLDAIEESGAEVLTMVQMAQKLRATHNEAGKRSYDVAAQ